MVPARSWRVRLTATFVALLMAVVSAAVCYAGTVRQEAEHSCCAEMGDHCMDQAATAMASHVDCCATPPVNLAPTVLLTAVAPSTDWVEIVPPPVIGTEAGFAGSSFDRGSPPTYLLVSAFRI